MTNFLNRQNLLSFLLIFITLVIFWSIRWPYMANDFSGKHDVKYLNIGEIAYRMSAENNLLFNQKKYESLPQVNPEGKYKTFGIYPILEWSITIVNEIFKFNSFETNLRITLGFYASICLAVVFFTINLISKRKSIAFLTIILLAVNPIFQLAFYVTVLDSLLLILLFITLYTAYKFVQSVENYKVLYYLAIVNSFAFVIKYSAIIIVTLPVLFFIFISLKESLKDKVAYAIYILLALIYNFVLFRTTFRYLPDNPYVNFTLWFIGLLLFAVIFHYKVNLILLIKSWTSKIFLISNTHFEIIKLIFVTIFIYCFVYFFLKSDFVQTFTGEFFTDKYLLFNVELYRIFIQRLANWTHYLIFISAIYGSVLVYNPSSLYTKLLGSLFVCSIAYIIITSKVLYFHEYYFLLPIVTIILTASTFIVFLYERVPNYMTILLVIFIIFPVTFQQYHLSKQFLSPQVPRVKDTALYLNTYLKEDEYFMRGRVSFAIPFYSDKLSVGEDRILSDVRLKEIFTKTYADNSYNLSDTMKSLKIKYYVTDVSKGFSYNGLIYLATQGQVNLASIDSDSEYSLRSSVILCSLNKICPSPDFNSEDFFEENIKPYMKLEKRIGNFEIYSFY